MSANHTYDRGESVKLDRKLVDQYRELSDRTMMPVSKMIERAMMSWLPAYARIADEVETGNGVDRD